MIVLLHYSEAKHLLLWSRTRVTKLFATRAVHQLTFQAQTCQQIYWSIKCTPQVPHKSAPTLQVAPLSVASCVPGLSPRLKLALANKACCVCMWQHSCGQGGLVPAQLPPHTPPRLLYVHARYCDGAFNTGPLPACLPACGARVAAWLLLGPPSLSYTQLCASESAGSHWLVPSPPSPWARARGSRPGMSWNHTSINRYFCATWLS